MKDDSEKSGSSFLGGGIPVCAALRLVSVNTYLFAAAAGCYIKDHSSCQNGATNNILQ